MRKLTRLTFVAFLATALGACEEPPTTVEELSLSQQNTVGTIGSDAGSLGKITLDTDVSSWDIGTGQSNGEFITAENQGVQLGLRAQKRFEGLFGRDRG